MLSSYGNQKRQQSKKTLDFHFQKEYIWCLILRLKRKVLTDADQRSYDSERGC